MGTENRYVNITTEGMRSPRYSEITRQQQSERRYAKKCVVRRQVYVKYGSMWSHAEHTTRRNGANAVSFSEYYNKCTMLSPSRRQNVVTGEQGTTAQMA